MEIGLLDKVLSEAIDVKSNRMVLLSGYTYDKERFFHPDILFCDYFLISPAMRNGFAVSNPLRPRHLVIGYLDVEQDNKPYKLVLKSTRDDSGIHVETFHRIDRSEFYRLLKQGLKRNTIIRNPYPFK